MNSKHSILFVVPNLRSIFGDVNAIPGHPHTGIAYLTASLKQNGVHVEVYDERIDGPELLPELLKKHFDLIGITAFSYSLRFVYKTIERIRSMTKVPTVIGGPHVSVTKIDSLKRTGVNFAVKHEGEITTLELLEMMKQPNPDYSQVKGLIWRNGDEIVENPDRPLIQDLDTLPYPDYEAFRLEKYPCSDVKALPFITQRGCPYHCNFCSVPVSMGQLFRCRDAKKTVDELEHWYRKGWRHFQFNDDVFNIRRQRVMDICRMIQERGMKITWELYNGIRVNVVDEEMMTEMKKSGCVLISYGCESGNTRILNYIQKGLSLDLVRRAVEITNKVGINCSVNFIVGHPTETIKEATDTLNFARSLPATFINFYNDTPYPGTKLFKWVQENATLLHPDYLGDFAYYDASPIYETADFTKEERMEVLRQGRAINEWSVLRHRMGKTLGAIAFYVTRWKFLHRMGRTFVTNTRIGHYIFSSLSSRFGGMVWVR